MTKQKPLKIGISSCLMARDPSRPVFKDKILLYGEETLLHWAMEDGNLAFLIPRLSSKVQMKDFIAELDGVILHGGADVCPESYREKPLKPEWSGDQARDVYEIELIRTAVELNKPVLGICRGIQILNVTFGGTLYQDILTQVEGARSHREWDHYEHWHHELVLLGKTLGEIYVGQKRATVNSIHHQAVKDLAPDFRIEARSADDHLIESMVYEGKKHQDRFVMGVQWHPEFQLGNKNLLDQDMLRQHFIQEVRLRLPKKIA
jgi:putative glutamine amidotransferase